jgi:Ca2+-binding EF-hand superfamily protein
VEIEVSQQEIVSLYERFCQLDRSAKGFVSEDEFLSIPEFSTNPLSQVSPIPHASPPSDSLPCS